MKCNKKKLNLKSAKTILKEALKSGKGYRKECRYYLCDICENGVYHLTSQEEYDEKIQIPLEELVHKEQWEKLMEIKKGL